MIILIIFINLEAINEECKTIECNCFIVWPTESVRGLQRSDGRSQFSIGFDVMAFNIEIVTNKFTLLVIVSDCFLLHLFTVAKDSVSWNYIMYKLRMK
jgi:hypothetical protein